MIAGILALLFMLGIAGATANVVFEGTIASDILSTNRFYRVYLPPEYESSTERYPVLYVHDGQNAFSTAGPHAAFGWGNWELDKTADRLIGEKKCGRSSSSRLIAVRRGTANIVGRFPCRRTIKRMNVTRAF